MSQVKRPANTSGTGMLKFNSMPPRVILTSDDPEFDEVILDHWKQEGFDARYVPYDGDAKAYKYWLQHYSDELEIGESYALIAYGDAAAVCLDIATKPVPHMCALVAYYPTAIPSPKTKYPAQLNLMVHLAASQNFAPAFNSYVYADAVPGFAEHDLDEYDKIAAGLAWTRTLGAVRKGFKIEVDLETIWEEHLALEFATKDATACMATMIPEPYVNHIPTLTGGIGAKDLSRFYRDYFIPNNPPSTKMKLVSRTIGTDRVVDEMVISFRHTQIVDWILPDVPPTNKMVSVAMVGVVCIRGGKLYHEHLYWDQASVLVQIGLLDPKLVPENMKKQGLKQLPVYGVETAQKVLDEESHPSNELIANWNKAQTNDSGRASKQNLPMR